MTTQDELATNLAQRFEAALTLHRDGRLREAEAGYRAILDADPAHFDALLHLGVAALQDGQIEQAALSIRAALAREPDSAAARCHLATALLLQQRNDEAITLYEEALALDPHMAEAYYGLANVLRLRERRDEAIACYQRAIAVDPDYAEAYCGLAEAYQAQKLHAKAIDAFEEALAIDPDYAEALCGLGRAFQSQFRYPEAIERYEKALAVNPAYAEAHNSFGTALQALDRHEEALRHYERALSLRPDYADARCRLGLALQEIGRLDEARRAFEQAIDIEPGKPQHYYLLTNAKPMRPGDPYLAALESLTGDIASFDIEGQIHLHFALAKAAADCGDHAASFRHLVAGNALKRRDIVYDEAVATGMLDRIAGLFSSDFLQMHAHAGDPTSAPIFIVGMPRSGSTLIEQILAGHPRVFAGGERSDMRECVFTAGRELGSSRFPEFVSDMGDAQFRHLGSSYRTRMEIASKTVGKTADRYTDKTLNNFCLIGIIRLALPNARILHCLRDPVDTCLSCFSQLFGAELPYTYDLAEMGRYYRRYAALMDHWRSVLPDGVMLDIQYEELVGDFEPQARRLVAHCGLDWSDACLDFHKTERPIKTASMTQVRQPIYKGSVGRWRPDREILRPLLEGLGVEEFSP